MNTRKQSFDAIGLKTLSIAMALLVPTAVAPSVAAQAVHVVDASGATGAFTDLQSAVDAAADGDLLLVEPGTYGKCVIDGKGLTIVANGTGVELLSLSIQTGAAFDVVNLPAGSAMNVAGLDIKAGDIFLCTTAMRLTACQGPVQIRDCSIAAVLFGFPFPAHSNACEVLDSAAVSIVDTNIDATNGLQYLFECDLRFRSHGLLSETSNVFVHGGSVASGEGYLGDGLCPPSHGGDGYGGWTIIGGFGLGRRVTAMGGIGGKGNFPAVSGACGNGGSGGPGLSLLPTTGPAVENPSFVRSSMVMVPGVGGQPSGAPCSVGLPGNEVDIIAGTIVTDDFAPRVLETEFLARIGTVKTETYTGEPFDFIWHVFGAVPAAPVFVPELTAAPTIGRPFFVRFRGLVPASGQKSIDLIVPELGTDFVTIYEEAYFYDGTRFYVSNPQFSVLLDDGF